MHIPAVEAEEALQMLAAHDLDLLPAADPVTKDSPYARTKVLLMLSYVHRASTRSRLSDMFVNRHYLKWYSLFYAGAAARVHPFPSAANCRQGLSPFNISRFCSCIPSDIRQSIFRNFSIYAFPQTKKLISARCMCYLCGYKRAEWPRS